MMAKVSVARRAGAAIIIALAVAGAAVAAPKDYGLPQKLRHLGDLRPFVDGTDKLTNAQATEVLLTWFKEEHNRPSYPREPVKGVGPPTSGYVQTQILWCLGVRADGLALDRILQDKETEPYLRDAMVIALGMAGDGRQIPALIRYVESDNDPSLRSLASRALGDLGATGALPALERVRDRDGYSVKRGDKLYHPVREQAAEDIRILHKPDRVKQGRARAEGFAKRLEEARRKAGKGK